MKLKEAKEITGGLSNPSKMPGYGYNLPATACLTGDILSDIPRTVCYNCYARKGRYAFSTVQNAMHKRLEAIYHPEWVEAMTTLIGHYCQDVPYFRFHDSGDIQSLVHLNRIVEICRNLPNVHFWLPTVERFMVDDYLVMNGEVIPKNLTIRISMPLMGSIPTSATTHRYDAFTTSSVIEDVDMFKKKAICPATIDRHECGDCRKCWDSKVKHVIYKKH